MATVSSLSWRFKRASRDSESSYNLPHPRVALFDYLCCISLNVNFDALESRARGRSTKQLLSF